MKNINSIKIGILSDLNSNDLKVKLKTFLEKKYQIRIIDIINDKNDINELVSFSTNKILSSELDFIIMISISGNTFQIIANKIQKIRAVVLPDKVFIAEAIELKANMFEIDSTYNNIMSAKIIFVELFKELLYER